MTCSQPCGHPPIRNDSSAILRSGPVGMRQRHGLIVKGKRISCPPPQHLLIRVALPVQEYDYEHGFPLIRSLRASTQRSTSVLFSFVLSLLIVAGSFAIRQSKTRPERSCAAWRSDARFESLI